MNPDQDESREAGRLSETAAAKNAVRRTMLARRDALSAEEVTSAAAGLHRQLLLLLRHLFPVFDKPLQISVYSAIRREADLSLAWPGLLAWPADLFFPAVQGEGRQAGLTLARLPSGLRPDEFLEPGRFGICEPPRTARLRELPWLDLVLVPGLAFNENGGRIGWGKGYYDRLLRSLPGQPLRIGVAYGFQILTDSLPLGHADEKMDWLLTPQNYFRCAVN